MYRNKYLKYKTKYINLVNMIGGSFKTAKDKFKAAIKKNSDFLLNDPEFISHKESFKNI